MTGINKRPGAISLSKTYKIIEVKIGEKHQHKNLKVMIPKPAHKFTPAYKALTIVRRVFVNPPPSMPSSSLNATDSSQVASYLKEMTLKHT
jgi:hypothetical protein